MGDDKYQVARGQAELYPPEYFSARTGNDSRRQRQFAWEGAWLKTYCPTGRIMDVGCSTGEFLAAIEWPGERYGMEISEYARTIAETTGVQFHPSIFEAQSFFDCVVFRGTIQHIDEPFRFVKYANRSLVEGGFIVFLATPNTNAPLYRLKKRLPFTTPALNFLLPDDITLPNALRNFGFLVREIRYPYWDSPYRSLISDHAKFMLNALTPGFFPHAFWRSSMEIVAEKIRTV